VARRRRASTRAHIALHDGGAEATARVVLETNPVLALGLESVPSAADALRGAVAAALAPHEVNGQVRLAASALVVTATAA